MNCHVATYSKFFKLLTIYVLPHVSSKLGNERFIPNCVMPYGNQGFKNLT
jgi:hypothetical protein